FALFIPYKSTPPSVAKYAGSEYYGIIEKLNEYNYDPPEYKNTFELLLDLPSNLFAKAEDWAPPMAPGATNEAENMTGVGNYQEVTDNQVSGVIEADLIKRSDTHIYYLSGSTLRIFSIEGEDSRLLGTYHLAQYGKDAFFAKEFFLSSDCRTLTVICQYMEKADRYYVNMTRIVTLDVSDPKLVKEISHVDVSGQYLSSRLTEHGLLLMTTMNCRSVDFGDTRTFIPEIATTDKSYSLAPDDIIAPETLSQASYTVMLLMDDAGTTVTDAVACLSYAEDAYVSKDAIYATRSYYEYGAIENGRQPYTTVSEISCIGYSADGFDKRGSVIVDGYVLDQYSMDEYEGMLRVFTTTQQNTKRVRSYYGNHEIALMPARGGNTSASLFVIDLATMQIAASVEKFAPVGEVVKSARFEGNTAYACIPDGAVTDDGIADLLIGQHLSMPALVAHIDGKGIAPIYLTILDDPVMTAIAGDGAPLRHRRAGGSVLADEALDPDIAQEGLFGGEALLPDGDFDKVVFGTIAVLQAEVNLLAVGFHPVGIFLFGHMVV
ncbi:MAG: beta-propeller domain-containing protein, partial [Clostridia bacterium]|nr:beta-propeller domain-containing protein [Clostridia bacterium]